jgi:acyl transferase domain-containing protein
MNHSAQTPAPRLPTSKNMETINTAMGNVAHTTSINQINGGFRADRGNGSTKGIVSAPEGEKTGLVPTNLIENRNVVFAFTGSASQFDGMGKQLYETSPFVRQLFQEHDEICRKHNLPSFLDLITQNNMTFASASPIQTQLAIVSFDLVMANLWQHWGIQPNAVTGFSLGQFPALVMAGVISLSDMFFLVGKRAEMIVKECTAGTHAMVATFDITASQTKDLLQQMPDLACDLACISATKMMAICGPREDIHILSQRLTNKGIKAVPLDVPYAFHSAQMDPVLEKFQALAETVSYDKPRIPYASTLLGQVVTEGGIIGAK